VTQKLTTEQMKRCAELLEVIVRPDEEGFGWAIEEAQKIFGYRVDVPQIKRGRPRGARSLTAPNLP